MAARLTEGMTLLAHLVDGADTETFKIGTDAHGAAQKLMASLESVMTGALFDTLTNNGNST